MDEVVVQASIRQKLRQKFRKAATRKSPIAAVDDKDIDRQVRETLTAHHDEDRPSAEQCINFFTASSDGHVDDDTKSDVPNVRPLFSKCRAAVDLYQSDEKEKMRERETSETLIYNPLEDGIAVKSPPNGSNFFRQPLKWPSDGLDFKLGTGGHKPLHKPVSLRGMGPVCEELFPCQLSTPLLKSPELREEALNARDPYDAETIRLKAVMQSFKKPENSNRPVEESLNFCSLEEQLSQPRMRMILMRSSGAPHLRQVPVPLNEREVPLSLLVASEQRDKSLTAASDTSIADRKENAIRLRDDVQQKLLFNSESRGQRILTLQDLVHEEETTAMDFAFSFLTASGDRRPLHPIRKDRKKRITTAGENISIIVTVLHASNLPVRTMTADESESLEKRKQSLSALEAATAEQENDNQVTPFVEAVFQRQTVRTSVADGSQATWNQTLDLSLNVPNGDMSPAALSKIKEHIILNLCDEVVTFPHFPKVLSVQDLQSLPAPRMERRWLGSLAIPFSTLYLNTRIEGTFAIETPVSLLDYEFESPATGNRKSHSPHAAADALESNPILLTLFLTIDPPLPKLQQMDLNCDTDEDEALVTYARLFEAESVKRFPDRRFRAVVVSMECKWVFVTRYLRPLRPPDIFHDSLVMEQVMHRLARYVSLIPSHADFSSTGVVKDIWMTADQFLDIGTGDEEEHAILLCNFFLYLGRRAGLVIGSGIPEGLTCYVITYEYSSQGTSVWNACTGQRYAVSDPFIPLNSVSAIVMMENVFANCQSTAHPNRIDFDLEKGNYWTPLFNKKTEKWFPLLNLTSVQPEVLQFPLFAEEEVRRLQEQLEKHIKSCLMRWRPKMVTYFNRSASLKLKKLLLKLEKESHTKKKGKVDVKVEFKGRPIIVSSHWIPAADDVYGHGQRDRSIICNRSPCDR